jgi:hypothetical protein
VGEGRVASAEDQVGLAGDAELLLERGLDVDLAEDANPSALSSARTRAAASLNPGSVVVLSV